LPASASARFHGAGNYRHQKPILSVLLRGAASGLAVIAKRSGDESFQRRIMPPTFARCVTTRDKPAVQIKICA
jgi:hypothetical protein